MDVTQKNPAGSNMHKAAKPQIAPVPQNGLRITFDQKMAELLCTKEQILSTIPKLLRTVCSEEIIYLLSIHTENSRLHIERLKSILAKLSVNPQPVPCPTILSLLSRFDDILQQNPRGLVRDAQLLFALQNLILQENHMFEMMTGMARAFRLEEIAKLLRYTWLEDKALSESLEKIAGPVISIAAVCKSFQKTEIVDLRTLLNQEQV